MDVPDSVIIDGAAPGPEGSVPRAVRVPWLLSEAVTSIVSSEPALGHDEAMEARIRQANWLFPHFANVLRKPLAVRIVNESDSMRVIIPLE
jgi:hypothetical protein